ncbi:MAG: rhomboid family intramembrane serine protease, partial [Alphaproteobacteria bacterium]
MLAVGDSLHEQAQLAFAVVPNELLNQPDALGYTAPAGAFNIAEPLTLITYMFVHGNFMHLLGNMLFLWGFGDNVEDAMGHFRFVIFYLVCGVVAGLAHVYAMKILMPIGSPALGGQLIGASGAVSGIIAAYLIMHPNVRVWVLFLFRIPLRISAGFALMVWVGFQVVSVYLAYKDQDTSGTAYWAHIGGLVTGAILITFMRKPGFPLFDLSTGLEDKDQGKQAPNKRRMKSG